MPGRGKPDTVPSTCVRLRRSSIIADATRIHDSDRCPSRRGSRPSHGGSGRCGSFGLVRATIRTGAGGSRFGPGTVDDSGASPGRNRGGVHLRRSGTNRAHACAGVGRWSFPESHCATVTARSALGTRSCSPMVHVSESTAWSPAGSCAGSWRATSSRPGPEPARCSSRWRTAGAGWLRVGGSTTTATTRWRARLLSSTATWNGR